MSPLLGVRDGELTIRSRRGVVGFYVTVNEPQRRSVYVDHCDGLFFATVFAFLSSLPITVTGPSRNGVRHVPRVDNVTQQWEWD